MHTTRSHEFQTRAVEALHDETLRTALGRAKDGFVLKRRLAFDALPEYEQLRDRAVAIKNHTLEHLDHYLERYEQAVIRQGGQVHWAENAEDAQRIVVEICREAGSTRITKGKSMVGEEVGVNAALEAAGMEVVETDLGEYIIQLAGEPPSHIIAPAVHKTKGQISDLFHEHHAKYGLTKRLTEIPDIVNEARQVLRQKYLDADVGITGANFLIAETGLFDGKEATVHFGFARQFAAAYPGVTIHPEKVLVISGRRRTQARASWAQVRPRPSAMAYSISSRDRLGLAR